MVVIYRQDLFSDDLNALFDEFKKKKIQQFSLDESLLQLFVPMLDAILLVNRSDIDSFYLIYHVH